MHEDEFRDQRSRAVNFYYAVPWSRHMKNVRHMTDDQISALARREAEKDVTRAINIWNENH